MAQAIPDEYLRFGYFGLTLGARMSVTAVLCFKPTKQQTKTFLRPCFVPISLLYVCVYMFVAAHFAGCFYFDFIFE